MRTHLHASIRSSTGNNAFLHARYDGTADNRPPATHYGKVFSTPRPLHETTVLRWRWRVLKHPNAGVDAWQDVAASVYVITREPSLLHAGQGFKFGWLAKAGADDSNQHGIRQVPLPPVPGRARWQSEKRRPGCALPQSVRGMRR